MFCTKCSAEMLDGDLFCPRCGAPQKIRNGTKIDSDVIKKTAATVDVTPEDDIPYEEREYIGQHKRGSDIEQTYSGYYESVENTKKKKASSCFLKAVLIGFFAVIIIIVLLCGISLINGENPIDYAKDIFYSVTEYFDKTVSESDIVSPTVLTSASDATTDSTTMTTTTSATTMFSTTKNTTTTTKRTTTTTKPTTTTTPVGQLVRDTSVGKWTANISALNLSVLGSKIKTINITIDKNGNANVNFKVGFVTVKTTGSFTVADDGRTDLTIKVPYSSDVINVVGYSKVVTNDQIVFRCSEGDITLNRK